MLVGWMDRYRIPAGISVNRRNTHFLISGYDFQGWTRSNGQPLAISVVSEKDERGPIWTEHGWPPPTAYLSPSHSIHDLTTIPVSGRESLAGSNPQKDRFARPGLGWWIE